MLDGHNDLAILIRFVYQNNLYNDSFIEKFEKGGMFGQVDIPRLKVGKSGGAFWSAFTPCPANGTDFSNKNYVDCKLYFSTLSARLIVLFLGRALSIQLYTKEEETNTL